MLRVLETAWLLIALMGLFLGTFKLVTENMASALWFYLFTSVAVVFWLIRRKQRMRSEKRHPKS